MITRSNRYWINAPKEVQEFILPAIDDYYRGKDQVQRDEAMRSCGIAAQTLMLAAKSMGYDSCPMDGFDFEKDGLSLRTLLYPSAHPVEGDVRFRQVPYHFRKTTIHGILLSYYSSGIAARSTERRPAFLS